jgi:hypothetical protein
MISQHIQTKQEKWEMPLYGTVAWAPVAMDGDNIFGVPVLNAHNAGTFRFALKQALHGRFDHL